MANSDLLSVTSGNAKFANEFYRILSNKKGNVFFSPISAHLVLALAYQGAAGETANKFAKTLNIGNQKVAANGYNSVINTLNNVKKVTLHLANKVFVMKGCPLKSAFENTATKLFLSKAEQVNFAENVAAAKSINQWVEQKTNSKIKDLIKPEDLDETTCLVLVNAIYFKGNWAHQFKKELTKRERFYISNNDKIYCQMMHIKKCFNYREDKALDAKVLELPYDNENVSMVVILPNARDGIKNLENKLVNVDLSTITQNMGNIEVEVSLPKFKVETTMDLYNLLTEMGLGIIFSQSANFSEICSEPLVVSKVIQKAFIEVNEEGAEAAAATAVIFKARCARGSHRKFEFIADHPFLVLLQVRNEDSTHILFYGRVMAP